jgi:hypothetical protein
MMALDVFATAMDRRDALPLAGRDGPRCARHGLRANVGLVHEVARDDRRRPQRDGLPWVVPLLDTSSWHWSRLDRDVGNPDRRVSYRHERLDGQGPRHSDSSTRSGISV